MFYIKEITTYKKDKIKIYETKTKSENVIKNSIQYSVSKLIHFL